MSLPLNKSNIFGFIKTELDAHTLGINSISELLKECGYQVVISGSVVNKSIEKLKDSNFKFLRDWIISNSVTNLGFSYRLDPLDAVNIFGKLFYLLKKNKMMEYQGGIIKKVYFAGLPSACSCIHKEYKGEVKVFSGTETLEEVLDSLDVPDYLIPAKLKNDSIYDNFRMKFSKKIINEGKYLEYKTNTKFNYEEFGKKTDNLLLRLSYKKINKLGPVIRAHMGPYSSNRKEVIKLFLNWSEKMAKSCLLDVLSIGSSQLSQSDFGKDWRDKPNGGGVPVNSSEDYLKIWSAARPMLVRTYAGTKNISKLARIYEDTINISWHALSLWWFCELDGRGPYKLYQNLKEHMNALDYIAFTGKPFEANVSHHFSFRGGDDLSYIVSAYLAAKLAKLKGIKYFILQNMLNTPKHTWGIQDLAKSRAMLFLVKSLEDKNFKIILQNRAGLDYFSPEKEKAKVQLSMSTMFMDDIEPYNENSPDIVHVVGFSEAYELSDPTVVKESIKITKYTLEEYRKYKRKVKFDELVDAEELNKKTQKLMSSSKTIISAIEKHVMNTYSPEGFYTIFASGFLQVPFLWSDKEEFKYSKFFKTKMINGGVNLIDEFGGKLSAQKLLDYAVSKINKIKII
jgi:hypothetical protein